MKLFSARSAFSTPQRGVAAVEFALIASVFFPLLFGIVEVGRVLWIWNSAAEATRLGARIAVVCGTGTQSAAYIRSKMQAVLGTTVNTANISITSDAVNGTVSVKLPEGANAITVPTYIPYGLFTPTLPPFTTTLTQEYMTYSGRAACTA